MRKTVLNHFILLTNAMEKNINSLLEFTVHWLKDNGLNEDKTAGMKTAICEAMSNVVDHAYDETFTANTLQIEGYVCDDGTVKVAVRDEGKGIADLTQAMTSLFTTGDEEKHSGMGFTVMEAFVDTVKVRSKPGKGTSVLLFTQLD